MILNIRSLMLKHIRQVTNYFNTLNTIFMHQIRQYPELSGIRPRSVIRRIYPHFHSHDTSIHWCFRIRKNPRNFIGYRDLS